MCMGSSGHNRRLGEHDNDYLGCSHAGTNSIRSEVKQ